MFCSMKWGGQTTKHLKEAILPGIRPYDDALMSTLTI